MMQKSHEEYHQELEPEARERVKRDLVLNAIADAEDITASQDDVAQWLDNLNAISGDKPVRMSQLSDNQLANIDGRIRRDKALARLIDIATEGRGDIVLPDLSEFAQAEDADEVAEAEAEAVERGAAAAATAGAEIDGKAEAEEAEAEAQADAVADAEEESEAAEDADVVASAKASTPESTVDTEVPETEN
jgi:trigger factor